MHLIKVRGENTLEQPDVKLTLSNDEFSQLTSIPAHPDEKTYYASIKSQIDECLANREEESSRKLLVQNHECISLIHFMMHRPNTLMLVYMRSSNALRLPSDIGFLSRIAKSIGVDRLIIQIGSFHVILPGGDNERQQDNSDN